MITTYHYIILITGFACSLTSRHEYSTFSLATHERITLFKQFHITFSHFITLPRHEWDARHGTRVKCRKSGEALMVGIQEEFTPRTEATIINGSNYLYSSVVLTNNDLIVFVLNIDFCAKKLL